MIRQYKGILPKLAERVFVAEGACLIGDLVVGEDSGIWYQCVIRADVHSIRIGARTNIQDATVIHAVSGKFPTLVGDDVTVGHSAILHGCVVENLSLVGMGSTVLDGAHVESQVLVGAGALVPPGMRCPKGTLVVGAPAKVRRDLTQGELDSIRESAAHYVKLAREHMGRG